MDKGWRFETNEVEYVSQVLANGFGASETGAFTERLENAFATKTGVDLATAKKLLKQSDMTYDSLEHIKGEWQDEYKLPANLDKPYSITIITKNSEKYLVNIKKITPDGIWITYEQIIVK